MKTILIGIFATIFLVSGIFFLVRQNVNPDTNDIGAVATNVSIEKGIQIIQIQAKGGYRPEKTLAKAEVPTIIRFVTNGTYDCSSSVRIPRLNIEKTLTPSGTTDITVPAQQPGILDGTCGMGMYQFSIDFEE